MIPGHTILQTLKEVHGERVVLRTWVGGCEAVTRVLARPVDLHLDALVSANARFGRGSLVGVPEEIALTLEAYRLRATLGDLPGLPRVLGAGVVAGVAMAALPPAPLGQGHVWVTSEWVPGEALSHCFPRLSSAERSAALLGVVAMLAGLHERNVLFGDVKPTNVVVGPHGVSFIDIDTLREVPDHDRPVPTRDLTPRYAAPEVTTQRMSYLASDVYALGVMVAQLGTGRGPEDTGFPGALGSPWDELVAACLRPAPQSRPTATALLAHLWGTAPLPASAAEDGTERVADAVGPVLAPLAPARSVREEPEEGSISLRISVPSGVVPAPGQSGAGWSAPEEVGAGPSLVDPEPPPPAALPRRGCSRGRWGCLLLLVLVAVGGVGAMVVLEELEQQARSSALRAADAHLERLRRHKTIPAENGKSVVDAIATDAQIEVALTETEEGRGVYALATVWSQGWHWSKAKWDPAKFAAGEEVTRSAGTTTTGRLAQAMLAGAGCRLMPSPSLDVRRQALCAEAKHDFAAVVAELSKEPSMGWLHVEAVWGALALVADEAHRLRKNRLEPQSVTKAAEGLALCAQVHPKLPDAPVNGREVVEDCLGMAGAARDFASFFFWANWLVEHDLSVGQAVDPKKTLPKLYSFGAPECREAVVTVGKDLRPTGKGRSTGGWSDLCDMVGLYALGCRVDAKAGLLKMVERIGSETLPELEATLGRLPWESALTAAEAAPRTTCALPPKRAR